MNNKNPNKPAPGSEKIALIDSAGIVPPKEASTDSRRREQIIRALEARLSN